MEVDLDGAKFRIEESARFQVRDSPGHEVCCSDGKVWITQEGEMRDVFLRASECFVLNRSGLAIISLLGTTELQLRDTRSTNSRPPGFIRS